MPLVDHFNPPIRPLHRWESFHSLWCGGILAQLNQVLPARFYGEVHIHLGSRVAADVAEFDSGVFASVQGNGAEGGVAVATWAPPAATATIDAIFPDDLEVRILDTRDGATLAAVVELVSPSNKDREDARDQFAAKCAAYLQRGIGLAVIDVVTERHFNLHNVLMGLMRRPAGRLDNEAHLYATSYRPVQRQERSQIDLWLAPLTLGQPLPTLPLALKNAGCVPLELEASYTATRTLSRI
jgi:hypothetical protein